jgi:hypothetical protein
MAKKRAPKETPAPKVYDEELQNAVVALLETGDDEGCEGNIVCQIEEFRKVRELLKDRTGEDHGNVSDDNMEVKKTMKAYPNMARDPCVWREHARRDRNNRHWKQFRGDPDVERYIQSKLACAKLWDAIADVLERDKLRDK